MDARHRQAGEIQMGSIYRASAQTGEEEDEEETDWQKSVHFGYALINDACWSDALGKLARHEATLMKCAGEDAAPASGALRRHGRTSDARACRAFGGSLATPSAK